MQATETSLDCGPMHAGPQKPLLIVVLCMQATEPLLIVVLCMQATETPLDCGPMHADHRKPS